MLVSPKPIKMMDCISNGLDTATTYDIIKATKSAAEIQDTTFITALLQPPPEVFNLLYLYVYKYACIYVCVCMYICVYI
jgi:hypothetical protein